MEFEASKRIDKGIKRGARPHQNKPPRYAHKPPKHPGRMDTALGIIPADLNPQEVLERYLTESTTSQIAAQYGVSRKTLVRWLKDKAPDQWKQVQIIRALCRKEDADEGIENACDALSLARAREMLRSGQWDLERLDSHNYGQKQEVSVTTDHKVTIEHTLTGSARELFQSMRGIDNKVIDLQPTKTEEGGV